MVNNKKNSHNQTGLASFLVTLIMMIIITLVVLGFAQIARREQREALDNQLSSAAYYAAESGVNDAINAIDNGYLTTPPGSTYNGKPNCQPDSSGPLDNNNLGNNSSYSCLLVSATPSELRFQDVAQNESTITPLQTGANPTNLTITWKNVTGTTTNYGSCPAARTFISQWPTGSGCGAGILRIDLIPATALGNSSDLQDYTYTAFFVPQSGGAGSTSLPSQIVPMPPTAPSKIPPSSNGAILAGNCGSSGCVENITNIKTALPPIGNGPWYLRMTSIYNDSNVIISATPATLTFQHAQIDIDSTGKASDVLKRILVAVPYGGATNDTPFALQTTDSLCKHFFIQGPSATPTNNGLPSPNLVDTTSCYGQ